MARLCEITFARSEEKGQTWTWDEIYERVNGQPRSSDEEWRHVDKWVRHLNQKASKNGHDDLLLFSGGSDGVVQRLV